MGILNRINYEEQLIRIIRKDASIMAILHTVEKLGLNDAWVCAGLIRNKVWDVLHKVGTPINDIDVVYFDCSDTSWESEKQLEAKLELLYPNQPWSVKNQARMHLKSGFDPFTSTYDGVSHFPEIPTAIAVRMNNNVVEIMAPYGLEDLFEMKVSPTPVFRQNGEYYSIYVERIKKKKWDKIWPRLSIEI